MAGTNYIEILKNKIDADNFAKISALKNSKLHKFVAEAIELFEPAGVFICTDDAKDIAWIREYAKQTGEEKPLAIEGHTYHFDGPQDQGRDKEVTKYLLPKGTSLGQGINSIEKQEGLSEIFGLMKGQMNGRKMLVMFFCLGPTNSEFSIPCVQITDSPYVGHSEFILYRPGYEQFKNIGDSPDFFRFMHTEGELENFVSKNPDKKRIYIDLNENIVYSVNTQYAGNTVGLKKLALRLAINKSDKEGWLAEHMFLMGIKGPKGRITYFSGAFPSACGKTSTAMLPGQTIIGDDIAYLRIKGDEIRCVNVEQGIFGIIQDVNPDSDPVIYKALNTPGEVIFGNCLIVDGRPYWLGMGRPLPEKGLNYIGQWTKGMKDSKGADIHPSHKNARYTVRLDSLANCDKNLNNPKGVVLGAVVYGGRDSDTCVPVEQAYDWTEGIIAKGASLESETTAATIGTEGVRSFNLMSNLDFLAIPLGKYIQNNLDIVRRLKKTPLIFSVNYFLRDENRKYLNGMLDKLVWMLWAELRVHGDIDAVKTPTGLIPKYKDLAELFSANLKKDYATDDYVKQFTIRIPQLLAKYDRIEAIYRKETNVPQIVFETFKTIRGRLKDLQNKKGDYVSPLAL